MIQLFMLVVPTLLVGHTFSYTQINPLLNRRTTALHSQSIAKAESPTCSPNQIISSTNRSSYRHSIHLVSLPPKDDSFSLPAESLVRECWKWKDAVLGDGRDYFVPRPKSLRAFHSLFVGMEITVDMKREEENEVDERTVNVLNRVTLKLPSVSCGQGSRFEVEFPMYQSSAVKQLIGIGFMSKTFLIEECVALSNCARFEVILVLKETTRKHSLDTCVVSPSATSMLAESAARLAFAYNLWRQIRNYKSNNSSLIRRTGLASWLDLPDSVDTNPVSSNIAAENITPGSSLLTSQSQDIINLSQRLAYIEGGLPISRHLSLIAGGLASRTNRPDRDVIFRPYSSRDAHILLQLKRTAEVVSVLGGQREEIVVHEHDKRKAPNGRGRIKILLDGALSAGKAVRNENIVPEIRQLKEFGSDGTPPIGLANVVAAVAIRLAVNPSVDNCVARLKALEASNQISLLRQRVDDVVSYLVKNETQSVNTQSEINSELKRIANELLHVPTMKLREGDIAEGEVENVVQCIQSQLKEYYCSLILEKENL